MSQAGPERGQGEEVPVSLEQVADGLRRLRHDVSAGLSALSERIEASAEVDRRSIDQQLRLLTERLFALRPAGLDGCEDLRADIQRLNEQLDNLRVALTDRFDAVTPALDRAVEPLQGGLDRLAQSDAALRGDLALITQVLAGLSQLAESGGPLGASVDSLTESARARDRVLHEALVGLSRRIAELGAASVEPVRAAVEELRSQVKALPAAADLGPVASQLARLSATIVSQARNEPATSAEVSGLSRSIDDALQAIVEQVHRQAEATTEVWAHLARQPSPAERMDDLRHEVGRATAGLRVAVEKVAAEAEAPGKATPKKATAKTAAAKKKAAAKKAAAKKAAAKKATATRSRPIRAKSEPGP